MKNVRIYDMGDRGISKSPAGNLNYSEETVKRTYFLSFESGGKKWREAEGGGEGSRKVVKT